MQKTKGTVDLIVIVKSDQSFAKTTNDKPLSDNSYISINEYLGVGYIKSYLMDRDIPVNIHVLTNDQRELLDQVADSAPFIVGFTLYADTATEVLSSIRYLSQRSPNTYIVVGGPQTYEIAESLLRDNLEISSVIFGEGEETFYELYNRLSTSQTLKDCAGTAYRQDNGTVILNPFRTPIANLDSLSFPARDIYEKNHQEFLYITGARGCLGRCSFCGESTDKKHMKSCDQVRLRSAKNIVDEMEFLYHKYKNNSFRFTDPTFEDPGEQGVQKASEVFREIKKRNLSVSMHVFSRVENVIKLNDQYFQQGYDAGLDCIYVGIESGNAEDLKLYNKPTTVQNNQKALQIIRRNHIHASFGFINFNPYSTYERLIQNAEFLYHSGLGHVFYLYQTRLEVLPTVPIKTKLIRENLMAPGANYKTDFYDYKFADPQMGVFFRAVKAAYPKTPIYYMDTLCGIYRSWFKRRNQDDQELNSIFKELETMQNTLRDINHELFSNMLEMHRKGCDYNEFLAYIQGHPIDNYHEDYEKLYKKINIRVKKSVFKEIMSK